MNDIELIQEWSSSDFKNKMNACYIKGYLLVNSGRDNGLWWAIFSSGRMDA